MLPPLRHAPQKRPIQRRCFGLAAVTVCALLALWANARGEPRGLTEPEAVALGLSRPALREVTDGRIGLADAERERIRRWSNPVASFQHEETDGRNGSTEDYAWLSQTFDLAGRRRTRAQAAERRVGAARAEGEGMLASRCAAIRERFYETLFAQERAAAFTAWLAQGTRVGRIIEKRARAGEASGYDRRRFEQEERIVRAHAAAAEADLGRARAQLTGLVGVRDASAQLWTTLSGSLRPNTDPPPLDELVARLPERADLRVLAEAQRAAELDRRAAGRWWLPDLTIGAGVKTVEVDRDRLTGPFISASVPLPLLNQDQGDARDAAARFRVSRGEYQLALEAAEGDVQGLWSETISLTRAALEFRTNAIAPSTRLVATAEQAYQAGEMELLGLIDAHRGALEAELKILDIEMNARRAWIELARTSGGDL